jgi:hypothetical protein
MSLRAAVFWRRGNLPMRQEIASLAGERSLATLAPACQCRCDGKFLKLGDTYYSIKVFLTELRVQPLDFLFIANERTTQTVIFILVLVVEHIHIDLAHQTARTAKV